MSAGVAVAFGAAGCNLLLGVEGEYHLADAGTSTGGAPGCTASCCHDADCPASVCSEGRCDHGACVALDLPEGTPLPEAMQTKGDCQLRICDGKGAAATAPDDADPGSSTATCTVAVCDAGAPTTVPADPGATCTMTGVGPGVCAPTGACVECLDEKGCPNAKPYCVAHACVSAQCSDQAKGQQETDVDCGGPACPACDPGQACLLAADCKSGVCTTAKTCAAPTCTDQVRNGAETDVDCGGACPTDCDLGRTCLAAGDCKSGSCCNGTCASVVTSVVAGNGPTACAITTDRHAHCWGHAGDGALGNGSTTGSSGSSQPTPVEVTGLDDVAQLAVGYGHACARRSNGTAWCWGLNDHGQLGIGATGGPACSGRCVPQPTELTVLGNTVKAIAAGDNHTCAVKTNGTVWCWGNNANWQLGNNAAQANVPTPVQIMGLTSVAQVAVGAFHTCVVKTDGSVWCWGTNGDGQLGNGTNDTAKTPTKIVAGTVTFASVAAGSASTCARSTTGALWCWGANNFGQVGTGSSNPSANLPLSLGTLGSTVLGVSVATFHACARKTDGSVWCWGLNAAGEVGTGGNSKTPTPSKVPSLTDAVEVTAGLTYSCARKTDGSVWCWGGNDKGQLGTGQTSTPLFAPARNQLGVCP